MLNEMDSGLSSSLAPKKLFNLKIKHLKRLIIFLPVFALAFGILWAIINYSTEANYTHCKVM